MKYIHIIELQLPKLYNNMKANIKYFLIFYLFVVFANSQSLQDMKIMQAEYEKSKSNNQLTLPNQNNIDGNNIDGGLPKQAQIIPYQYIDKYIDSTNMKIKHFGYDFFTKRDTVGFWENLPPPKNYILGPGDEIIITLWGETQLRKKYVISRDGKIYDDKVGLLNITGKTIKECRDYLEAQFSRVYSTLKGRNALTFMDVSMGELKSININFVGEVKFPGIYPVHPFSNVITGLIQAGGVDTTGSLRKIKIKRTNSKHITLDLYDYLLDGTLPKDIQLRDDDIVVVPVRLNDIVIDSGVVRPAIYEFLPGESIKDMIYFAGGLRPNSSSTIGISRITPLDERTEQNAITENYYLDYKNTGITKAQNGDRVTVQNIFSNELSVEIIGQVKTPGKYNYFDGMKVMDLIMLSGGFNDTTFWKSVYRKRAQIVRRNPDKRYEKIIDVNLNELFNGDISENKKLQNLDRFLVHANLNFFEKENIQISGEVNIPGAYPLISDNEDLSSILNRVGGLTSKALINGISIYRDKKYFQNMMDNNEEISNKNKNSKVRVAWKNSSIILMPGDSIVVRESTKTVNIIGAVQNPGLVEYNEGKPLRYYINSVGGITEKGNKRSIILVEPNGLVRPKKWYSSPSVTDGSTIYVSEKENTEPFDATQFATNWTQIISSVITAVILSQQIGSS